MTRELRSSTLEMLTKPPVREMISKFPRKQLPSANRKTTGVMSARRARGLRQSGCELGW
jgi:hypothetical protein